ncbi:MAG: MarR family transcriptional regulator [Collinsella sp.]|nr:MarR family transcriptional regulator [Collinsella sp.]
MQDASGPVELDYMYNAANRLYAQFATSCGLSSCAYWMLYELERMGGSSSLRLLDSQWSYSRQTINSALKSLEARGLIELVFEEGSKKSKEARLTERGREFVARNLVPAMEAEERAFERLTECERETMLRLVRKYTDALNAEFGAMNPASGR